MSPATIAEIEKLIKVQEAHDDDLQVEAAVVAAAEAAGLEFCCKYCDKRFYNKQALGGHQNAHRMERAMEKNAKKNGGGGGFMDYGFLQGHNSFSPFSNFPSLPGGHFPGQFNFYQDLLSRPPPPSKPYFLPGQPIPAPEIPTRPPYAYPFPPHARVLPPAMMTISGADVFSGVPANSPVTPRPGSILNCNPRNNQEIKDGELDLTLKL